MEGIARLFELKDVKQDITLIPSDIYFHGKTTEEFHHYIKNTYECCVTSKPKKQCMECNAKICIDCVQNHKHLLCRFCDKPATIKLPNKLVYVCSLHNNHKPIHRDLVPHKYSDNKSCLDPKIECACCDQISSLKCLECNFTFCPKHYKHKHQKCLYCNNPAKYKYKSEMCDGKYLCKNHKNEPVDKKQTSTPPDTNPCGPYFPYFFDDGSSFHEWVKFYHNISNKGICSGGCENNANSYCTKKLCGFIFCDKHKSHQHFVCSLCDNYATHTHFKLNAAVCSYHANYQVCDFYGCKFQAEFYGRCKYHGDRVLFK